ncbi:DUF2283 domain-containing protein [Nitrospira sp. Kam-Ns4a]
MEKIKVVHDTRGHTLTVWLADPSGESVCEETADEVVLIKDAAGRVIGFELLHYHPEGAEQGLAVETVIQTAP